MRWEDGKGWKGWNDGVDWLEVQGWMHRDSQEGSKGPKGRQRDTKQAKLLEWVDLDQIVGTLTAKGDSWDSK